MLSLYNVRGCLLMISQMASDSQVQPGSMFGRDRWRGTFAEGALVDSDETQPPSQPLDHPVISHDERPMSHGSSNATGNPGASEDRYRWAAEHASLVKEAYWDKGQNRLKDMVCKEKYQSLKVAKQVPPSTEDDSLFLEAVGGWSNKGTVYGLGNSVGLFYEKPVNPITWKMPCYTPSIASQLQSELEMTKTELNSTKNELQQQRTSMEEQQRQLEQQQRKLEEQTKMMEDQQRMLEAQCKMMEDQKQALLGFQSQMALMSSLLGHPSELHDSEK
ncbi:hypothetical protein Cgig2_028439 [Carnegiea gigantea]|uniref:Uncharacterized protein n=1 Tax=Carnegiea gigantea TaxID=171969 RepID=A0A9Q1QL92_9CARY|nr:hypothetical protein Cgig2_028439 [Carnegiea gigantea]